MANTLINLTLLKVLEEIENLVERYPTKNYRIFLVDQDLQNKLLAYVLSRIPNRYVAVDVEKMPAFSAHSLCSSALEQLEIEDLIQQGVYYLLNQERSRRLMHIHRN